MHRLFVALRPTSAMRRQLLDLMDGVPGARWQTDEQLHLTLAFIGEVDRPGAEDIAAALGTVDRPRPTIALQGVGRFDQKGRPHSLWAGIADDDALRLLRDRIGQAIARAGVSIERRAFRPHITVARLNRQAGPIDAFVARVGGLTSAPAMLDAFLLYESHLGRDGATYEPIARYPLTP